MKKLSLLVAIILGGIQISTAEQFSLPNSFPCEVTGYYSPLPGQSWYLNGSFADEIRMNGEGFVGADGTPVAKGMLAAPKEIAFGTQIHIPGIGNGEVHDRGGKILLKDGGTVRLDVWTGHGEEALAKALKIGVIRTTCTQLKEKVHIPFPTNSNRTDFLTQNLEKGMKNNHVKDLQELLQAQGFLQHQATGYFGTKTQEALIGYQLYHGLIRNKDHGHTGKVKGMTRIYINAEIREKSHNGVFTKYTFSKDMKEGDTSDDIRRLQSLLGGIGYFHKEVTSYFGTETKKALQKFQKDKNIVDNIEMGGRLGPKTRAILNNQQTINIKKQEKTIKYEQTTQEVAKLNTEKKQKTDLTFEKLDITGESLSKGQSGQRVYLMQQVLRKNGYLNTEPSGFFGQNTEKALIEYQIAQKIITHKAAFGSGIFGPSTQKSFSQKTI